MGEQSVNVPVHITMRMFHTITLSVCLSNCIMSLMFSRTCIHNLWPHTKKYVPEICVVPFDFMAKHHVENPRSCGTILTVQKFGACLSGSFTSHEFGEVISMKL